MGNRFVRPSTTILTISDGDTLTVKTRLTHGERSDSYARQYTTSDEGKLTLIPGQIKLSMVTAYLVDWSLTDAAGQIVPIFQEPVAAVEAALNTLSPEDFDEVYAAIAAHERKLLAERAQEKKQRMTDDAATSRLRSVAGGASTGSVS